MRSTSFRPDQREAIILIGASGFSYEEAAEVCQCAVGTIKSRVSRARTQLQQLLGVSGPGRIRAGRAVGFGALPLSQHLIRDAPRG
jgi:DNA-directed RNA polymerase specialized sigma subunit, sigma24 homolog